MKPNSIVAVMALSIITTGLLSCKDQGKEREMMTGRFDLLFEEAVRVEGDRYRKLRAEIVELDPEQAGNLRSKLDDPDWHVSLQAEIFTGWREEPERYEFIQRVAYGTEPSLEPEKYLTGKPPIEVAARVIIDLGSRYAPALLELIYKERDVVTEYAYHVCNHVMTEWKEQRATPVYREIMLNPKIPTDYRDLCIRPLLDLEAENLFDDLVSVYDEKENHPELRAAALATLGELDDDRTIPLLEKTLRDTTEDSDFRCAAATGLSETGNVHVIPVLTEQYRRTDDSELKKAIVFALGSLESRQTIQPLKSIRETEQDKGLQELIDNTLLDLEYLDK